MWHFILEILLTVVGYGLALDMLRKAVPRRNSQGIPLVYPSQYARALFAWVPVFVCEELWHPLTGHYSHFIPGWWLLLWLLLFAVAAIVVLLTMLGILWRTINWVVILGALLVLLTIPFVGWFLPRHWHLWHWSHFAWLLFAAAVCAVVAIVLLAIPAVRKAVGFLGVVAALVALLLLSLGLITRPQSPDTHQARPPTSVSSSTSASSSPTPSGSSSPSGQPCATNTVKLDPNAGANLFSKGLSPVSAVMKQQVLDAAGQDPRVLQVYFNASSIVQLGAAPAIQNVTDIAPLQDGACYTPAGQLAYNLWANAWKLAKVKPATLPVSGTNTGAQPKGPAFQQTGTIPPGHGFKVVYVDISGHPVSSHWVRQECGNVVTQGVIKLPAKPVTVTPIVSHPVTHITVVICRYLHHSPVTIPPGTLCPKLGNSEPVGAPIQVVQTTPAPDNGSEISRGAVQPTDAGNGIPSGATSGPSAARSTPAAASSGHHGSGPTMSSTPTEPASTVPAVSASPTASGTISHGT